MTTDDDPAKPWMAISLNLCDQVITVVAFGPSEPEVRAEAERRDADNPLFLFHFGADQVERFHNWLRSYGISHDDATQIRRDLAGSVKAKLDECKRKSPRQADHPENGSTAES